LVTGDNKLRKSAIASGTAQCIDKLNELSDQNIRLIESTNCMVHTPENKKHPLNLQTHRRTTHQRVFANGGAIRDLSD